MSTAEGGDGEFLTSDGDVKLFSDPSTSAKNVLDAHPSRQRLVFADPVAFR